MINITKPFLPPREEYDVLLKGIWERNWLTNDGPLVLELESKIKSYLGINQLSYVNNGTIALQFAMRALELKGEIITTPFSFIATTSSIVWEHCTPVFADIDENSLNISPESIEHRIGPKTCAILATHVYGNPCDIDSISSIAAKYNLKVIYDAAHCFGTKYHGKSVFEFGDVSTCSFHATKLFHTIEGGSVSCNSEIVQQKVNRMRNFGFAGYDKFDGLGINGKNSEFHAAMGLCNIKYIDAILKDRKTCSDYYDQCLVGLNIRRPIVNAHSDFNRSYYPIIFSSESELLRSKAYLEKHEIFTRRYFYPVLSGLDYTKKYEVPIAEDIAKRVLCLPLYFGLSKGDIDAIGSLLIRVQNKVT